MESGGDDKVNRKSIARFFVGSCAALLAAAVAVPARAQVPAGSPDSDGRYVEEEARRGSYEYDGEVPYSENEGGQYEDVQPYDQDAYADPGASASAEGYVIADDCATGCDVTTWGAPYVSPYVGTTIVFGAPFFRAGHWHRPYYHRSYSHRSYDRSYARPGYRSHGYGGGYGWRGESSHRSYAAPHGYTAPRTYGGGSRGGWNRGSGSRSYGGHSDGGGRSYGGRGQGRSSSRSRR